MFEEIAARLKPGDTVPGAEAFRLYDTYGLPADFTEELAKDRGLSVDTAGFERELAAQQERARQSSKMGAVKGDPVYVKLAEEGAAASSSATRASRSRTRACSPSCATGKLATPARRRTGGPDRPRPDAVLRDGGRPGRRPRRDRLGRARRRRSPTPRARCPGSTSTTSASATAASSAAWWCAPRWTPSAAPAPCATTPAPTCCTRRCARCWARTSSRRAAWWPPTGCASTSATTPP